MTEVDSGKPPRRLTRAEAKAQTRQRLLDAAGRVFAEKGFGGASLEEIAESAGYSTGALYANFANKEALFMELVSARRAEAAAQRAQAVSEMVREHLSGGADPSVALTKLFVEVANRDRALAPLQAEFWLYAVRNPAAMKAVAASLAEQASEIEPAVSELLDRLGGPADATAQEVTTVLLALFQGLVRRRRFDTAAVPDDLVARAVRWLLVGMHSTSEQSGSEVAPDNFPAKQPPSKRSGRTR